MRDLKDIIARWLINPVFSLSYRPLVISPLPAAIRAYVIKEEVSP